MMVRYMNGYIRILKNKLKKNMDYGVTAHNKAIYTSTPSTAPVTINRGRAMLFMQFFPSLKSFIMSYFYKEFYEKV
jgi:hypothetical protein